MLLETLVVGPLAVNCYVIGDENTREALVIDPGDDAQNILDTIRQGRLIVKAIVNTHAHFDHVGAVESIREASGAPFMLHVDEAPILSAASQSAAMWGMQVKQPKPADRLLREGDEVRVGAITFKVLHTPGHTPGGLCLLADQRVFVGDTLFQGSIGRTDFPGGDYATLMASIRDKLLPLPDETVVYAGHGAATTIGEEKQFNPFVRPLMTGRWEV
ncbi:MAG: MBL fold metallo-hydrolase [Chloroflexota bacterium]|nr:MBL fold metallo-hydrolase [Chloroflexota bacterium]